MAKEYTITAANIVTRAKRELSIIGRRLNQKEGDKNYSKIVLTDQEIQVLTDYAYDSLSFLCGQFPELITSYSNTGAGENASVIKVELVDTSRFTTGQATAFKYTASSYAFSYTVGSYLAMVYPELAKKYQSDSASYLLSLRNLAYSKNAPSSTQSATSKTIDYLSAPTTSFT